MMDFNERVVPGVTANFLLQEALARYEFAIQQVPNHAKVLDLACGTGYGSQVLSSKAEVIAIDQNHEAIKFAKRNFHSRNTTFMEGDVLKLPFPKHFFDIVCAFEIIEHLQSPVEFVREIKRVLKLDGKLILSTPNGKSYSPYHLQQFDYISLDKILNKSFTKVTLLGQYSSSIAKTAFANFLKSQQTRQTLVSSDRLEIRKLLPKSLKEFFWKYLGAFFGRQTQEHLTTRDFPISKITRTPPNYLVAVCQK